MKSKGLLQSKTNFFTGLEGGRREPVLRKINEKSKLNPKENAAVIRMGSGKRFEWKKVRMN